MQFVYVFKTAVQFVSARGCTPHINWLCCCVNKKQLDTVLYFRCKKVWIQKGSCVYFVFCTLYYCANTSNMLLPHSKEILAFCFHTSFSLHLCVCVCVCVLCNKNTFPWIYRVLHFEVRHTRCVGSITKNVLCITHTVEHNHISSSSTVGIQLQVPWLNCKSWYPLLKQRDLVPPIQPPIPQNNAPPIFYSCSVS